MANNIFIDHAEFIPANKAPLPENKKGGIEEAEDLIDFAQQKKEKLDSFFDLSKRPIVDNDFLHQKKKLYQIEDTDLVIRRAELKAQLKKSKKRLLEDRNMSLLEKQKLESEIENVKEMIMSLQAQSTGTMQGYAELAKSKKNRLRTNWISYILGEVQIIAENLSKKNIGGQYHFEDLQVVVLAFKSQLNKFLVREAEAKSALSEIEHKENQDSTFLEKSLKKVYSEKRNFLLQGMNSLHFVVTEMLEFFRVDCEQGEAKESFIFENSDFANVRKLIDKGESTKSIDQIKEMLQADCENSNLCEFIKVFLANLNTKDPQVCSNGLNSLLNILTVVTYADQKKQKAN